MSEPRVIRSRWAAEMLAVRFAVADLIHDRRLTLIGIILLAALIATPVVLHTLRVGLVETWAQDLARDVRNREVVIVGENRITSDDLSEFASWPETGFLVPEPSFFVSTQRAIKTDSRGASVDLNLRTTRVNDPVWLGLSESAPREAEAILSASAAERLDVTPGEQVSILLARTPTGGQPERIPVALTVTSVLPENKWPGTAAFVAPETLLGFREWLTFAADDPSVGVPPEEAVWQSMRIYAPQVADSIQLQQRLDAYGFETRLMTDQVDRILKLEVGLRQIFTIVLLLSVTAFVIASFLLQWLSVVRKKRDFALMTVLGLTNRQLAVFPVFQGVSLTAVARALALLIALALQRPVEAIVQGYLTTPAAVQSPSLLPLFAGILAAIAIGALAGIAAIRTLRPADLTSALRGD